MRYLRLMAVFFKTSVQTDMEYRADFFTRILASLLGLLTTLGGLTVVFTYTSNIKGWKLADMVVLLSVYYLMDGIIEMFIGPNMRQVMEQVRQGTLDFVLLKPVNAQFLATTRQVNIWRMANVFIGAGLSVYSVSRLSLSIGPTQAVAFALTLAASVGIVYAFWLFLVTLTFWVVRIDNLEQIVAQAFEAGRYPIDIYPNWLRGGLTYVVPVVFMITVPAQALAGRMHGFQAITALAVSAAAVVLSSLFWRFGLKNYTGASA
jgi:ABC-2 type transport system permease protein